MTAATGRSIPFVKLRRYSRRQPSPGKHSPGERRVMGGAVSGLVLRGERLCGWLPAAAEHELVQDFHGAESVLAGGVDVAADVEAVLGDVVAGEAAGDLLLGFQGPDSALADIVRGPDSGVRGEPEHVALAALAEFQQLAAGLLLHGVLRAGDAGDAGQPGQHRVPELLLQRSGDLGGDEGKLLLAGLVPGVDEAAQRPLRLHGPDG